MDLYILRHAIAEELSDSKHKDDSHRRLTLEGAKKMYRIAEGMKGLGIRFDLILTSPYVRARQTADIVADIFKMRKLLELTTELQPGGNPRKLIDLVATAYSKRKSILLVGHEPYLSGLISLLLSGDAGLDIHLKKGGLCKLSVPELKFGRCATLEYLLTPGQMRSLD